MGGKQLTEILIPSFLHLLLAAVHVHAPPPLAFLAAWNPACISPPPSPPERGTAGAVAAIEQATAPKPMQVASLSDLLKVPPEDVRRVLTVQRVARGLLARRDFATILRSRLAVRCAACVGSCTASLPPGVRRYLPWHMSQYDRLEEERDSQQQPEGELVGMAKMSRLGTDLANERTLLAWIRTVLAMMRTVFATLGVAGLTSTWESVHRVAVCLSVLLMVTSATIGTCPQSSRSRHARADPAVGVRRALHSVTHSPPESHTDLLLLHTRHRSRDAGIMRYYRIARICSLKNIPASFGKNRVPLWPMASVLLSSLLTVTAAVLAQGWEK